VSKHMIENEGWEDAAFEGRLPATVNCWGIVYRRAGKWRLGCSAPKVSLDKS